MFNYALIIGEGEECFSPVTLMSSTASMREVKKTVWLGGGKSIYAIEKGGVLSYWQDRGDKW